MISLIWIVLFFIIILISAVLAFRSMRGYEDFPEDGSVNSLFYIANFQNFTLGTLQKLHDFYSDRDDFFSLERLYKGKDKALAIYGSRDLTQLLPELNLVEIEDYLAGEDELLSGQLSDKKVSVNDSLTWVIEPKNSPKKALQIGQEIKQVELLERQKFFIQCVCMGLKNKSEPFFQSTLRIMVADTDSMERVALAKKVENAFLASTGLNKFTDNFPEAKKFESFKLRSLVPKEVTPFSLSFEEVYNLLS